MIEFNCPRCQEPMSVPESVAGGYEPCPTCEADVPVPGGAKAKRASVSLAAVRQNQAGSSNSAVQSSKQPLTESMLGILARVLAACAALLLALMPVPEFRKALGPQWPSIVIGSVIILLVQAVFLAAMADVLRYLRSIAKSASRPPQERAL